MDEADAFVSEVSAYPAVTVIRSVPQRTAVVGSIGRIAIEAALTIYGIDGVPPEVRGGYRQGACGRPCRAFEPAATHRPADSRRWGR
jgi:hypothetical protein